MILRPYQPQDCPALAQLFYDTVHTVNAKDYTPAQLDAWATGTVDLPRWNDSFSEHFTLVALEGEIIVGFGDMDDSGYLDRLYVHKDYQGQGVATALCDALEAAVPGKILTTHASITARPFFEKRGYRVIKEQQVLRAGQCLTNFVMEKAPALKVALASARFVNGDIPFNLAQIEGYLAEAKARGAALVCFGESFLQGFDCLTWDYDTDKASALTLSSPEILRLAARTAETGVDLLFGFIEKDRDCLYSTCVLLGGGKVLHQYRRISRGWKEYWRTDSHYREGNSVTPFSYRGRQCLIAVCGDLWEYPERFSQGEDLLFWPVYVDFPVEEWEKNQVADYARQASLACTQTLLINSVHREAPPAFGGCFRFVRGEIRDSLPMGREGLLLVDLQAPPSEQEI